MEKINIIFFTEDKSLVEKTKQIISELGYQINIIWQRETVGVGVAEKIKSFKSNFVIIDGHINLINLSRGYLIEGFYGVMFLSEYDSRTSEKIKNLFRTRKIGLESIKFWLENMIFK